jgi:hypothetical protein
MPIGPSGSRFKTIPGRWGAFGMMMPGVLTTALTGTNNDLTYTAVNRGLASNSITITYTVAGASTPLTVGVVGTAITVNVATNGSSVATSTAAQVRTAVLASAAAALLVGAELAAGNDGTGVVTALATTPLAGGADWTIGTAK